MRASQNRPLLGILCAAIGFLFGSTVNSSAAPFTFTYLQYPGTTVTEAFGINNQGQIVGFAAEVPGSVVDPTGFLYQSGTFMPLVYGNSGTYANGINNLGIVVGTSGAGSFLYNSNTGVYSPFSAGGAQSINDLGQIVGYTASGSYFFDGTAFHTISYAGADATFATSINNSGQIVGYYRIGSKAYGFVDNAGVFTSFSIPGASSTYIAGINNLGETVGYYSDPKGMHGFVNLGGQVTSFDGSDIPAPEDALAAGRGVNDSGVVAGYWQPHAGAEVLIATPTPEPGTLCLFGTGLMTLAGFARGRVRASVCN